MNHSFFKFSFDRIYIAVFILLGLLKCPLIQAQTSQVEWIVGHDQIQGSREDFPKCGLATTQGEFVSAGVTGNQLIVIKIGGEGKTNQPGGLSVNRCHRYPFLSLPCLPGGF